MLFYIFIAFCFTLILGLGILFPNNNKPLLWSVFVLAIFILGFRDYVGVDFAYYVGWYNEGTRDNKIEFGYLLFMNMFRYLKLSYHFLFFLFSFFTCFFLFFGIKKYTKNQNFAFLIFLILPQLYLTSFSSIRQSLSVSICFFAFYYLMNKKYTSYLILMLIAFSMHFTTIFPFLIFLLVFIYYDKFNERNIFCLLLGSFLISKINFIQLFHILFEKTRYSYYFSIQRDPVNIYKIIILNLIAVFVLFNFEKLKNKYPYHKYILPLFFFSVIFINLFSEFAEMSRITYYFRIFEIIVIADLIFLEVKWRRICLLTGFYLYYIGAFVYTLNGDLNIESKSKLIPYRTFILQSSSY